MKVELRNLRSLSFIEVMWRPIKEQGRFIPLGAWYYVEGKGNVYSFYRPKANVKGQIIVIVSLPGFFDFEYSYKEHEKTEIINVTYERR